MDIKRYLRGPLVWVLLIGVLLVVLLQLFNGGDDYKDVDTSKVVAAINHDKVKSALVTDKDQTIQVTLKDGEKWQSSWVQGQGIELVNSLQQHQPPKNYNVKVPQQSIFMSLLISLAPIVLLVLIFLFIINQMQGGGNKVMNFGKSKAKQITKDMPKTTFNDVAGMEETIEELAEIKQFLENPAKFQQVGAKIPKGVLLYGAPGTGKTLLARAVSGEAGVPFYSISGSDFVEMFVGVGASRVRDLFEQAKANAPAIVFMDEIDAVGRQRGAGLGGGHDEREQTLNQLLVEMDGFDVRGGVILIAATNRPDILDPALLRPGRFDRQIVVDRPDMEGRKAILQVHARGKPMAPDADLAVIARRTPGFTGADLQNVVNEAALLTARSDQKQITMETLEESIDRVMAGPERRSRVMSEKEKKLIAYHEGGHAIVGHALPNADPVHKITILSRGRALGYTMSLPTEDKFLTTRSEMLDQLAGLMGGRAAEELVFHEPTTGASNDIEKATSIARNMATQYGMSERLGARKFGSGEDQVFLGREMGHERDYSEEVASTIDEEVRRVIERSHDVAWEVLVEYRDVLDNLVLRLMEKETLQRAEVLEIFAPVQKRAARPSYAGYGKRLPDDRPPIMTPKEQLGNGASDSQGNGASKHEQQPAGSESGATSTGQGSGIGEQES